MDWLVSILFYGSYLSVLVPIFFLFFRKAYSRKRYIQILGAFLFISVVNDFAGYVSSLVYQSNIIVNNTYVVIQFLLLSLLYYELFQKTHRLLFIASAGVFITVFFTNTFFFQGYSEFQNITLSASAIILSTLAIKFLSFSVGREYTFYQESSSVFWINAAILYYFCANLWLFVISSTMDQYLDPKYFKIIWVTHNFNNILKNAMFAIGLYWAGKKPASWEKIGMN